MKYEQMEYEAAMLVYNALPMHKRLMTKKPQEPIKEEEEE